MNRKHQISLFVGLFLFIGSAAFLGGCETTEGAGQDIENLGEGVGEAF